MRFINPSAAAFITLTILLLTAGCGGPNVDRTTWLIVVGADTIPVGTAMTL